MPDLVFPVEVNLGLFPVLDGVAGVELSPGKSRAKLVVLPGRFIHRPFGVDLFLRLSTRRHGDRIGGCFGKTEVGRIRQKQPLPFNFDPITIRNNVEKECLFIETVLRHHAREYLPAIVLQLANVVLLESLGSRAELGVVLQSIAIRLPVSLGSVEPAAEFECLLLVFRPVLSKYRHFFFLDENASSSRTGGVVCSWTFFCEHWKHAPLLERQ